MLLAFVLNPLVTLLTRIYIPRLLATILVYALFVAALLMLPIIGIPLLIEQIQHIQFNPQRATEQFYLWAFHVANTYMRGRILNRPYDLTPYIDVWLNWLQNGAWLQIIPNMGQLIATLQTALTTTLSVLLGATTTASMFLMQIGAAIFAFFLTLLYTFYLLLVAPRLRIGLYELFPESYHAEIEYLIDEIATTWRRYLRGQLFLCFVIFALTWVGLSYVGMPGAFALAIVAGILEIIPNLGPVLATIPAVIVALIQGSTRYHIPHWQFALLIMGLYTIIQQLENNLLVPRIVGNAINVHPFLVLIGIVVGAQAGGVLGALLAAPTLATLRILAHYVHARLLDRPPYPELVRRASPESPPRRSPAPEGSEKTAGQETTGIEREGEGRPVSEPDITMPDWLVSESEESAN